MVRSDCGAKSHADRYTFYSYMNPRVRILSKRDNVTAQFL